MNGSRDKYTSRFSGLITPEILDYIRVTLPYMSDLSHTDLIERLKKELFERYGISPAYASVRDYISVARNVTSKVQDLYSRGEISYRAMFLLSKPGMDLGTKDWLADEFIERKMTLKELQATQKFLRAGFSASQSIKKATGEIPEFARPDAPKKVSKPFKNLVKEIGDSALRFRTNVEMAIEMLPATSMSKNDVAVTIFQHCYMLKLILSEQMEFVEKKLKQYANETRDMAVTEYRLNANRMEAEHDDGTEIQRVQDQGIHEGGSHVPDSSGETKSSLPEEIETKTSDH